MNLTNERLIELAYWFLMGFWAVFFCLFIPVYLQPNISPERSTLAAYFQTIAAIEVVISCPLIKINNWLRLGISFIGICLIG
jgi:hypothetical protein